MATGDELRSAMRRFPAGHRGADAAPALRRHASARSRPCRSSRRSSRSRSGSRRRSHELIRDEGGFALSLLAGDQAALAQHFARSVPPIALWEGVDAREGARGPLLAGALAWFDCAVRSEHSAGDHTIFVAEVERIELGRDAEGLVYRAGGYSPA